MWENFSASIDNSFFFVIDKIFDLQNYFLGVARQIGYVVLLIAILTSGLNYALTGTGLKENIIKIMKATVLFFIVIFCYPKIIGWISSQSFKMAEDSVYPSIKSYLDRTELKIEETRTRETIIYGSKARWVYDKVISDTGKKLFPSLSVTRNNPTMSYSAVLPSSAIKVVFFLAGECIRFADDKTDSILPEFSRILKGLICAFFLIFTGIFAIIEYCVCFLEFMLVSSVGVILFPLSLWEGSKFMAEKYIGAIIGFFIKLLFCTLSIFLMLYGFTSLYYIIYNGGFQGQADQITFIAFTALLFFFICKSAPMLAQSLLTGTPSLSAAGAIGAVAGAVGAAASVGGFALGAAKKVGGAAVGGAAKGGFALAGDLSEANAASGAVKSAGGSRFEQAGAWVNAMGRNASDRLSAGALNLTRSLLGGGRGSNPHGWREDFLNKTNANGENQTLGEYLDARRTEGAARGTGYLSGTPAP